MSHWLQFIDLPIAVLALIAVGIVIAAAVAVVFRLTSSKYNMHLRWKGGAIELKPAAEHQQPQLQLREPPRSTALVKRK